MNPQIFATVAGAGLTLGLLWSYGFTFLTAGVVAGMAIITVTPSHWPSTRTHLRRLAGAWLASTCLVTLALIALT